MKNELEVEAEIAQRQWLSSHEFEQYEHHGKKVWVRRGLKGRHREHCLCFACSKLNAEPKCERAAELYEFCKRYGMVAPVWECPEFVRNE